jgi:hypothetical protein
MNHFSYHNGLTLFRSTPHLLPSIQDNSGVRKDELVIILSAHRALFLLGPAVIGLLH